jgi:hypothetical protein
MSMDTTTNQTTQPPAAQGTEAPAAAVAAPAPAPLDEQLAEALDKGIEDAGAATNTAPPKRIEPDAQGHGEPAPAPPAPAGKADTPPPAPAAAAKPDGAGDDVAHKAAVEAEITDLHMKGKTAERFRALSGEVFALNERLRSAGIKDVTELPHVIERARAADEWEKMVVSTGANPQQMGAAMDYLKLINDGTPEALSRAYDVMQSELVGLAKALGREAPGAHDPLADHADLREAIEAGDITRKHAMELVQARQMAALQNTHTAQQRQQSDAQQAQESARVGLNTLGEQLAAADPDYQRKLPFLMPVLRRIRESLPPERWVDEVRSAYAEIPALPATAPAPAAPRAPVGHVPLRPTGGRATLQRQQFTDPMEALEAGIAAASDMGG